MHLMIAAAVQAAIRPHQSVIGKRVHGSNATPVVPAVSAGFGADVGARKWISQAISDETQAQTRGGPAQKSLITGVIAGGHIAAGNQQRGAARRQTGAARTARAVRQAKTFIRNLNAIDVPSAGRVLVEVKR